MPPLSHSSHVLVTGGSRGIGREIARTFARSGAAVTILGRDPETLKAVVASGDAHRAITADVTDAEAMAAAIAGISAQPIDILITNAGAAESAPFGRSDPALFRRMMDVNFFGAVHAIAAVMPAMMARRNGRIVAIASTAGLKGYPYVSAYCAAKHAVVGLVRSLALEAATHGVTVNAVCPGFTDTDLLTESLDLIMRKTGRDRADAVAELSRHNPQGRLVMPREIASAVMWLCSPDAGAMTGQAIAVAGGEI